MNKRKLREKIREARQTGELDLSNNELKELPPEIAQLTNQHSTLRHGIIWPPRMMELCRSSTLMEIGLGGTFTIIGSGIAIGRDNEGSQQWLNGMLDEFAVFNRALSEAEIKQHMNGGTGTTAVFPADRLAGLWGEIKQD